MIPLQMQRDILKSDRIPINIQRTDRHRIVAILLSSLQLTFKKLGKVRGCSRFVSTFLLISNTQSSTSHFPDLRKSLPQQNEMYTRAKQQETNTHTIRTNTRPTQPKQLTPDLDGENPLMR